MSKYTDLTVKINNLIQGALPYRMQPLTLDRYNPDSALYKPGECTTTINTGGSLTKIREQQHFLLFQVITNSQTTEDRFSEANQIVSIVEDVLLNMSFDPLLLKPITPIKVVTNIIQDTSMSPSGENAWIIKLAFNFPLVYNEMITCNPTYTP